jgi:hypothetical protein
MEDAVSAGRVEDHHRVLRCRPECTGDLREQHPRLRPLKERGVVLHKDDRVVRLAEDRQELVCGECPADFEGTGNPADAGQDAGVVPADVEEHVPLQLRVGVQGSRHHL